MSKTQKELAFLRDLNVDADWTARFTDNFDKSYKFSKEQSILYINAGTGNHVLALREMVNEDVVILGVTEDEELSLIANAKAVAVESDVTFSFFIPAERFDLVIADASFVRPEKIKDFINETIELSDDRIVFFLPTAGSFGEIFSMLWEVSLSSETKANSRGIEKLVSSIPTITQIEEIAATGGLTKVKSNTSIEMFDYADGGEFVNSILAADYFLPVWLDFLEDRQKKQFKKALAETIDQNCHSMSFCFTVKATNFSGRVKKR